MIERGNDLNVPNGHDDTVPSPNMHAVSRGFTLCFGALAFAASIWYIWRTFHWHELAPLLKDVNLTCLVAGGGASIVAYWMLRALRWHILLRRTNTHVPLLDLYLCTGVSLSFAMFTPFQSGEVIKVELLKKYGLIQRSPGYGSFLVERMLDLAILLTIACVSLLTTINILPNRIYIYGLLAVLVLVCTGVMIVLMKIPFTGRMQRLSRNMRECVADVPTLLLVTLLTCVSWASVAFSWQVFLYSGGIQLEFSKAVALMSIVALISILSLIPGGIGISEAGASQLLTHFGFAVATAQAGAIVLRSCSIVAIVLGVGHLGLWKLIRIRQNRRLLTISAKASMINRERASARFQP